MIRFIKNSKENCYFHDFLRIIRTNLLEQFI